MSEIFHFPPSPSQPRAAIRETQQAAASAQLGPVEENAGTDDANTPAAQRLVNAQRQASLGVLPKRAAPGILGRPCGDRTTMPAFGRGQHAGFIQAQRHAMSQFTPPINQTQIEDPFEGSVHSFDNALNTRDFGSRFLHPHVAEGVGPVAGGTFPLLDRTWNAFSSPAQHPANANNLMRVDYMQVSDLQVLVVVKD